MSSSIADEDAELLAWQLSRPARGVVGIAHRCPCGAPDVVLTEPRLPDGTPFPTLYYLTCPRLTSAVGRLEGAGAMREFQQRLATDPQLAQDYRRAHEHYLQERARLAIVSEIEGISAGGMPDRVKCLHVLVAQALAAGPGVNPVGDEVLAGLEDWWGKGCCADRGRGSADMESGPSPLVDDE